MLFSYSESSAVNSCWHANSCNFFVQHNFVHVYKLCYGFYSVRSFIIWKCTDNNESSNIKLFKKKTYCRLYVDEVSWNVTCLSKNEYSNIKMHGIIDQSLINGKWMKWYRQNGNVNVVLSRFYFRLFFVWIHTNLNVLRIWVNMSNGA